MLLLDAASRDPTKTSGLRAKMRAEGERRWQALGRSVRAAIIKQDLLRQLPHTDKTEGFSLWLRRELDHKVLSYDGGWLRSYIKQAAEIAQAHARQYVDAMHDPMRVSQMETLAISELRGITAAAQQAITRSVTESMMAGRSPTRTANAVSAVVRRMRVRTEAMAEWVVAKTHAAVTLSAFRNAGVERVGIIPERVRGVGRDGSKRVGWHRAGAGWLARDGIGMVRAGSEHHHSTDGDLPGHEFHGRKLGDARHWFGALSFTHDVYDPDEPRDERGRWTVGSETGLQGAHALKEAEARGIFEGRLGSKRQGKWGDFEQQSVLLKPTDIPRGWKMIENRQGKRTYYDPKYAESYQLVPDVEGVKPKDVARGSFDDVKAEPGKIYRGMSYEEYQAALERGHFVSRGDYNIGEAQKGLTFYSTDPRQAQAYAQGFAPWMYKATPSRPAVIVEVADPGKHIDLPELGRTTTEVAVRERIPIGSISRVWLGRPYIVEEHQVDINRDKYHGTSVGGGTSYSSSVRWEEQHQGPGEALDARRGGGPGSRSSREETPSAAVIRAAERLEARLEKQFPGEVEVLTAADDLVCEECLAASEDGPYTLDQAEGLVPLHPFCRCICPGTVIEGEILVGSKAFYSGPIVNLITASGKRLRLTINHPVMTHSGLVPAGTLRKGDKLFSERNWARIAPTNDKDHGPSIVENIFETLARVGILEVNPSAMDLHGETESIKGDVQLVASDRRLLGDVAKVVSYSLSNSSLKVADCTFEGRAVSIGELPVASNLSHSRPLDAFLFGRCADFGAVALQKTDNSATVHLVLPRQLQDRGTASVGTGDLFLDFANSLSSFESDRYARSLLPRSAGLGHGGKTGLYALRHVSKRDTGSTEFLPDTVMTDANFVPDHSAAHAFGIHFDDLVAVERSWFRGHVYDLQSTTGYLIADGIAIGNCAFVPAEDARFAHDFNPYHVPAGSSEGGQFTSGEGGGGAPAQEPPVDRR
jgi:hypothetical protein